MLAVKFILESFVLEQPRDAMFQCFCMPAKQVCDYLLNSRAGCIKRQKDEAHTVTRVSSTNSPHKAEL
jgi:hypothetical protein